jgi:hypothetical protein
MAHMCYLKYLKHELKTVFFESTTFKKLEICFFRLMLCFFCVRYQHESFWVGSVRFPSSQKSFERKTTTFYMCALKSIPKLLTGKNNLSWPTYVFFFKEKTSPGSWKEISKDNKLNKDKLNISKLIETFAFFWLVNYQKVSF